MKLLLASILIASFAATAGAQTPAQPAAKPAAKKAAPGKAAPGKPVASRPVAKKPGPVKKAPAASRRQAIEVGTPTEDADPAKQLTEAELALAKRVFVGEIQCELGQKVTVKAMKREGFFFVSRGINKFVMHPVEARTGAIRLEDPVRGALWLQLANKSMLMSQKEGRRLADECQSPEQVAFAKDMKPINLLEPAPAGPATPTAPPPQAPVK